MSACYLKLVACRKKETYLLFFLMKSRIEKGEWKMGGKKIRKGINIQLK